MFCHGRLVYHAGPGNGKVPDGRFLGSLHGQLFAVQKQFHCSYPAVTQKKTLVRAPDQAFSFFEHSLFLRAGVGAERQVDAGRLVAREGLHRDAAPHEEAEPTSYRAALSPSIFGVILARLGRIDDADRALFVGGSGRVVNGDAVLYATARHLKSQGKLRGNRVVATTMSNLGLERALAAEDISLARAAVGDRYVLEEMLRSGNVLGGEQSGHIIFLDDSPAGDGLLTALKVASLVSMKGSLDALVAGIKDYPQTILNVKVRSKPPLDSLPEVSRALAEAKAALGENGRVVVRYSGTERLARVMVEAEHDSDVKRWSKSLAAALRSSIGA